MRRKGYIYLHVCATHACKDSSAAADSRDSCTGSEKVVNGMQREVKCRSPALYAAMERESSLLLLLKLQIPVKLSLDVDDTIKELVNDLITVGFECLVEFFEILFGLLVYGVLRVGG